MTFLRVTLVAAPLLLGGCLKSLGGSFTHEPEAFEHALSPQAKALVSEAYKDIPAGGARDYHTHLITLETAKTGGYVNASSLSWVHPIDRIRTSVFMSAAGITDLERADEQYLDRLVRLIRSDPHHGKHFLFAFDQNYRPDGTVDAAKSEFYTPNDYMWSTCQKYPDLFIPVISVNPNRPDALAELDRWGQKGVKLIKWLPNSQGIDASDPRLDPYYAKVREYGMTIITHVGEEQAVKADDDQRLGNPLLFRRPLNQGTRIIMAHAGSLGSDLDLDNGGTKRVPSYQLVLRLMKDPRYEQLLFADISALTQVNRTPDALLALLGDPTLESRLVNGSDYPVPAVNVLIHLDKLADAKLIDKADVAPLKEIYGYNPLVFDFVLKRRVHDPATGRKFSARVFLKGEVLPG